MINIFKRFFERRFHTLLNETFELFKKHAIKCNEETYTKWIYHGVEFRLYNKGKVYISFFCYRQDDTPSIPVYEFTVTSDTPTVTVINNYKVFRKKIKYINKRLKKLYKTDEQVIIEAHKLKYCR